VKAGRQAVAALTRAVLTGTAAAAAARLAYAGLRRYPPGGEKTWSRTNHRGEPVTLLEGPAAAIGAVAAAAVLSSPERSLVTRPVLPLAIAGTGAAAFGVYDDLAGSGKRRGLRGHLGALAHGEVTTGALKLAGIGLTGLASAVTQGGNPTDIIINTGLAAGGANLLNLFDLRPGRAIKVAIASGALLAAGGAGGGRDTSGPFGKTGFVAAPLGAAVALLPEDLGERAMLGDGGANALGAMLGAAAAATLSRRARLGVLGGIIALTVASEKISFTKVIEATPPLRRLDMLGRRPPAPPTPHAADAAQSARP
jgi:UDP-GlcNAc:undecaprenyl-phosphate/decaprenyl-phosphate GlcNAc-1-phosphate transferase